MLYYRISGWFRHQRGGPVTVATLSWVSSMLALKLSVDKEISCVINWLFSFRLLWNLSSIFVNSRTLRFSQMMPLQLWCIDSNRGLNRNIVKYGRLLSLSFYRFSVGCYYRSRTTYTRRNIIHRIHRVSENSTVQEFPSGSWMVVNLCSQKLNSTCIIPITYNYLA